MIPLLSLGIGKMELDWRKHNSVYEYSELFKISDIKDIPYYYADEDGGIAFEMIEGYSCKLSQVKRRLDLLGYDYASLAEEFNNNISLMPKHMNSLEQLSFERFASVINGCDISTINTVEIDKEYVDNGYDLGEYVSKCIFEAAPSIKEGLLYALCSSNADYDKFIEDDLSVFLENLDPYIVLRIICENPKYDNCDLIWCFNNFLEEGIVDRDELVRKLDNEKKILIVTEGNSDTFVLKKSINELFPDISDFFEFVDMRDNYPFTGTGNLFNFCKGMAKINIQNNVIVIFDNDTEGIEKFKKSIELSKPKTLIITKLPDMDEFSDFKTIGPQGSSKENINGKAVAIECFLDFSSVDYEPVVRWNSYNEKQGQYQGALEHKDDYVRAFKTVNLKTDNYDIHKLVYLVDYICNEWINK